MKESIFRKESLEKINSPGQLNRYIRVADSGTWLILAAILVLLLGAVIWGVFGAVETTAPAAVVCAEDACVCWVDAASGVQPGMAVRAGGEEGCILAEISAREAMDLAAEFSIPAEALVAFRAEFASLSEGSHDGEVVLERIAPISFVIQ